MNRRAWKWILICLLGGAGAWVLWHHGGGTSAQRTSIALTPVATRSLFTAAQVPSQGKVNTNAVQISLAEWNTNKFAGRLSNTTKSIGQLVNDGQAILLANALIDTREPLNFVFPNNLQSSGDPGAYIVQARGPIDNAFRALLAQAGATMVAYIPNDAYLVRASAGVANALQSSPQTQAVIPYEPYYKIQSSLLYPAVSQLQMPDGTLLNLGLFADDAGATIQQIEKLGGQVVEQDRSPFGPVVRVIPPQNWTTLATLSGVQIVEPFHPRSLANDLSRATVGVAANSLTATNYLNLTGTNIIVEVNDTGIDAIHPDFNGSGTPRVIGDAPQSLTDTAGHGTHVAGIIAGDGTESTTVTNAPGSTLVGGQGSAGQFRGMAPGAILYSVGGIVGGLEVNSNFVTDQYFQEVPARTNALISNNSWVFEGDSAYDLFAASYDAAVRDALPEVTGSQPVLFVFAAGNAGNGADDTDFGGGIADSIESPATAKNVITVGALQEDRNITNVVTTINSDGTTNISQPWKLETSTGTRVAGYSSRGNVGIGIEGTFGRYKPDVVAPGTFIISTRSEQWDIGSYFYQSPTNNQIQTFNGFIVQPGSIVSRPFPFIPSNAVELTITTFPNANSPFSFAVMPTLIGLFGTPGYQFSSSNDPVVIPGLNLPTLQQILNTEGFVGGFNFAISNNTASQIIFDLQTDIITTNGSGDFFLVLSNLNLSIGDFNPGNTTGAGPYYRYETGTSMATPAVSGTLALMQEFYANAYGTNPSPAMLKAMLINGARATGFYNYGAQNAINLEGWGLINLPDSLPPGITNQLNKSCSTFIQDQNSTNALATGDSQTFMVTTTNALPLHVTLAWTDPPGDPAAAIKLVNNLVLVVTNLTNPTNPIVYYGNDIPASSTFNSAHGTNTPPVIDSINNVQNVNLSLGAGTNFSVTVMGYRVNVNAVTAQTNNVVQDYALVISCGTGQLPNVMKVTATPPLAPPNYPPTDQQITNLTLSAVGFMTSFQMLLNQFAGANTPLLGTNTVVFSPAAPEGFGPTNWQVTVGMTNQWHFYVVTNNTGFSNAAFVTFNPNAPEPDTLSIPREGVFGGSTANASRDADIDLYVSTDSGLTNLDPNVISNCVNGTQIGAPAGGPFNGASLGRGTTEFVVDTNSQSRTPNGFYYVGVKSEDQMSAEYGFITIFSAAPFSTMQNGVQTVYGVPVPANIPDGSPTVPGKGYVFGLAIFPETVGTVTVSNEFLHQNFGDLIGTLTLNGGHADVLNNHNSLGNPPGPYDLLYDDSAGGGLLGSRPSDGPGSLISYVGQPGLGVWMLNEVDDSLTQTGVVNNFTTTIQPHQDLQNGDATNFVAGGSWAYDFIDVPPGATNLAVYATNLTASANPPVELFVKFGSEPTTNSFDGMTLINNPDTAGSLWGSVSLGPPLVSGRYFIGLFNPNPASATQEIVVHAVPGLPFVPAQTIYSSTDTPKPILDDAVTTDSITVPDNQTISSLEVALRVDHPRVSDLVFHLISPDGTRDLLVENRGGTDTNGMGVTLTNSVIQPQIFSGGAETSTNIINTGSLPGILQISYDFFGLPDELAVFNADNTTNFDSGLISGSGLFNITFTNSSFAVVMNPFGNTNGFGDAWTFTASTLQTNQYTYLVLTEDTNKTTTPIKFAAPPFGTTNRTIIANVITPGVTNITTNTDLFYLPEQSLDAFNGLNAQGAWTLEIQDDRAGASNNATLVSWQLRFNYVTTGTNSSGTPPGITTTNVIPAGSWAYYPVNVPPNADWATNILVFATGPLNMWFNPANNPIGVPPDSELLVGSTVGSAALSLTSLPNITPGQTYFIGLFNPNAFPVTNWFQVDFHFIAPPISLTNGVPITIIVPAAVVSGAQSHTLSGQSRTVDGQGAASGDSFTPFAITVPPNVDYVTNTLISATLPVNLWFNQNRSPNGTNPPNYELLTNSTGGVSILSASTIPQLAPGFTYYLAVENTNGVPVTVALVVNFHFASTNPVTGLTITATNINATNGFLLQWTGPTNYQYDIQWKTNLTPVFPWNTVSNPVFNVTYVSTNGNYSWFDDGSLTGGWPPAKFYRVVANLPSAPITNSAPTTNIVVSGTITPLTVTVPASAIAASDVLVSATGPVNVYFNQTGPVTGNTNAGDVLMLSSVTGGTFLLNSSSTPPLLPGANYYLGVQSLGTSNVSFVFQVNFAYGAASTNPPSISSITLTNIGGSNAVLLKWVAPTNYQFQVEWATNLAPAIAWHIIPNVVLTWSGVVSPTNTAYGIFQYLDDGSLTGGWGPLKFYRLIEYPYATPIPQTLTIINTAIIGSAVQFQWVAPTNYQYQVLWTTNLGLPLTSWFVLANPALGLSNGVYTFTDTNQTGPAAGPKFFRLLEQ